jgi:hypothetical protein
MSTYKYNQGAVQNAYVQYLSYTFGTNKTITLDWPSSYSNSSNVVANFMEVLDTGAPSSATATFVLPDTTNVSVGYNFYLLNSASANVSVSNLSGDLIATVEPGNCTAFFLSENEDENGKWLTFVFGAGVSNVDATSLAGEGLVSQGTTLNSNIKLIRTNVMTNVNAGNRSDLFVWYGGGGPAFKFPETGAVGNGFFFSVNNQGTGTITFETPNATIDEGAVTSLDPDMSSYFVTDGTNWYSIGRGQQTFFSYNVGTINLTGSTSDTYNLNLSQANKSIISFIGDLSQDTTVVFPKIAYSWYISNKTSGGNTFKLFVKMTDQTSSIVIPPGQTMIFYSDNINMYTAPTILLPESGFVFPDGSAANPSITFQGDQLTGLYLDSDSDGTMLGIAGDGNRVLEIGFDTDKEMSWINSPDRKLLISSNEGVNIYSDHATIESSDIQMITGESIITSMTNYITIYSPDITIGGTTFLNLDSPTTAIAGTTSLNLTSPATAIAGKTALNLTSPTTAIAGTTALNLTSPTTTVTGNLNLTGNLRVGANNITFPLPATLGGLGGNTYSSNLQNLITGAFNPALDKGSVAIISQPAAGKITLNTVKPSPDIPNAGVCFNADGSYTKYSIPILKMWDYTVPAVDFNGSLAGSGSWSQEIPRRYDPNVQPELSNFGGSFYNIVRDNSDQVFELCISSTEFLGGNAIPFIELMISPGISTNYADFQVLFSPILAGRQGASESLGACYTKLFTKAKYPSAFVNNNQSFYFRLMNINLFGTYSTTNFSVSIKIYPSTYYP